MLSRVRSVYETNATGVGLTGDSQGFEDVDSLGGWLFRAVEREIPRKERRLKDRGCLRAGAFKLAIRKWPIVPAVVAATQLLMKRKATETLPFLQVAFEWPMEREFDIHGRRSP